IHSGLLWVMPIILFSLALPPQRFLFLDPCHSPLQEREREKEGGGERSPMFGEIVNCRDEQYPCTRLYSVHKPCKRCLNEICFYSLRRVYVINKEICVRTVCAHEELLRADLCRDKFSKCGVMATSGLCQSVATSCVRSCGGC
uniref:Microfibril associated protein 2 n=1 Tax=Sphenodon punctatus TaxID=8508 RepID=A0A8D0H4K6_SPHPU